MTRAPRSTAGTDASAPPSLPKGVRAAATMTGSAVTLGLQHLIGAQQVTSDQDPLHLAGPLTDLVDLDVAIEARDRRLLHESHPAVDLYRLVGAGGGDLGRVQLRHRGVWRRAPARIDGSGSSPGHQPRQLDLRAHVGELELRCLEFGDRHAELTPCRRV